MALTGPQCWPRWRIWFLPEYSPCVRPRRGCHACSAAGTHRFRSRPWFPHRPGEVADHRSRAVTDHWAAVPRIPAVQRRCHPADEWVGSVRAIPTAIGYLRKDISGSPETGGEIQTRSRAKRLGYSLAETVTLGVETVDLEGRLNVVHALDVEAVIAPSLERFVGEVPEGTSTPDPEWAILRRRVRIRRSGYGHSWRLCCANRKPMLGRNDSRVGR